MIEPNKVVSIYYTLTNASGEVLDTSPEGEPLSYLVGAGNIIPGLENALMGKAVGDELEVTVVAKDAYGESRPDMIQEVPVEAFQGVDKVEVGMQFNAAGPQGDVMVSVTAVTDETVTVDANHPLAGLDLSFAVKVDSIRDASEEELAHGHSH